MKKKNKLGKTIKRRRKELGLSQEKLGKMCFCDERTIRSIENDPNYTTSEETLGLASAALYPDDPLRLTRIGKGISVCPNIEAAISEAICNDVFPELICKNLNKLMKPNSADGLKEACSALLTYLRLADPALLTFRNTIEIISFLSENAQLITSAEFDEIGERMVREMVNYLRCLLAEDLPEETAADIRYTVKNLQKTRIGTDGQQRDMALRAVFFCLYDNWNWLHMRAAAYCILSLLFSFVDEFSDTAERRKVFLFNVLDHFTSEPYYTKSQFRP